MLLQLFISNVITILSVPLSLPSIASSSSTVGDPGGQYGHGPSTHCGYGLRFPSNDEKIIVSIDLTLACSLVVV